MSSLAKTLTAFSGAGVMINIVIGAGLLALPGLVLSVAGDHALWAWAACALAALPLLIVFMVIGRRFPNAGGIAHFAKLGFGPHAYVVSMFILLGAVIFGLPAIALTGGYYISEYAGGNPVIYAMFLIIGASSIHFLSTTIAGRISTVVASFVLAALLGVTIVGLASIDWAETSQTTVELYKVDLSLVFAPFMMIFFAFTGWEVAAGISEEFKDPKRDFPIAMVLSFAAVSILYFLMAFVVQHAQFSGAHEAAFASIAHNLFGVGAKLATVILATVIIFANLMGAIWAVSRMVYSLSREGVLPVSLETNENGSPVSSVILTSCVLLIVLGLSQIGFFEIEGMLAIAGQNFFILSGVAAAALLKLSDHLFERSVAAIAVLVVVALIFINGTAIWYPLMLIAVSGIYSWVFELKRKGIQAVG